MSYEVEIEKQTDAEGAHIAVGTLRRGATDVILSRHKPAPPGKSPIRKSKDRS